jgi:DNA helicase-2/ATP-dependent DNA helicase PcrA
MSDFEGLEEERRLMYVAITRARKRLYLSHSQTRMLHGQTRYNIKSRFFDEMPEHTLKWLTPKIGLQAPAMWGSRPAGFGNKDAGRAGFFTPAPPAVPQRNAPAASGPNAWVRSGLQVFHAKFGEGTVVSMEGLGEDARAQVKFNRHGVKWLALSVAKLTPV